MPNVLVAGDESWRPGLAERLERLRLGTVDEADPAMGDVVMFIRLEGKRYEAVVFVGHADPVTRGALAVAAERAVFFPLVESERELDPRHDGYLFRLPRALGFRTADERNLVHRVVPKAAGVPNDVAGPSLDDEAALRRLLDLVATGPRPETQ